MPVGGLPGGLQRYGDPQSPELAFHHSLADVGPGVPIQDIRYPDVVFLQQLHSGVFLPVRAGPEHGLVRSVYLGHPALLRRVSGRQLLNPGCVVIVGPVGGDEHLAFVSVLADENHPVPR